VSHDRISEVQVEIDLFVYLVHVQPFFLYYLMHRMQKNKWTNEGERAYSKLSLITVEDGCKQSAFWPRWNTRKLDLNSMKVMLQHYLTHPLYTLILRSIKRDKLSLFVSLNVVTYRCWLHSTVTTSYSPHVCRPSTMQCHWGWRGDEGEDAGVDYLTLTRNSYNAGL
jgi:hypothetical protein